MKKILSSCLLGLLLSTGLMTISDVAQARCYWTGGYWRHGYWHQGHRVCYGHYYRHYRCGWTGGYWRHGYWHQGHRVCW